jgi:ABC-type multidrug transport system fused ATPase/permease subunit
MITFPGKLEDRSASSAATALLLIALVGAVAFRLYLLLAADFPVNDGALFLEFVRASAATFPSLPAEVEYNGLFLPFAYPPLSFWTGGLLTNLGFDSLGVVRVLPILMNIGYVLLFALLLLKSGRSHLFTALAILFFAVTLRSFEWLLMGGGLSRGMGSVFMMLALLAATVPDKGRGSELSVRRMALAGAAVAGAILSHLEWGILAAGSVVLSRALGSPTIKDFVTSCLIAGTCAFALVLPWLFFVLETHGIEPLLAAGSSSGWNFSIIKGLALWIAVTAVLSNPFILLGALALLVKRQWFWIGFIGLCVMLTPRHAPTPSALAIAVFAAQGIISAYEIAGRYFRSKKLMVGSATVLVAALLTYGIYRTHREAPTSFRILPEEMRQAMGWVASNHPGERFAIVNNRAWQNDSSGEWFPVLASARSVTTVQGREWNGEYQRWDEMYRTLRASGGCAELRSNLSQFGSFDLVWVETMDECFADSGYRLIFRNAGASIYRIEPEHPLR